ncbi:fibronectin type III domain-containing protein [Fulvivirgaceae bacterium BMA10]|uniref:Fibronectin type III domain-containing protein n=1 Tax=Splendidivirga corallicola TaxID=3051826 RepID=A0ABT8KR45_9BACT|nr:fibronectin type III domain-containing protein [Fulvivirgaceae bacterium BMA10]
MGKINAFKETFTTIVLTFIMIHGAPVIANMPERPGDVKSTFNVKNTFENLACTTPTGLFVLGIAQSQATLTWRSVSGVSNYNVRYKETSASGWTTQNVAGTNLLVVRGLTPSTQYEFQVRANCSSESSPFSASYIFTTVAVSCAVPTGLTADNITEDEATLSWNAVFNAETYQVRIRAVGATNWDTFMPFFNSFHATGLTPGVTYEFQVRTNCLIDNSNFSPSEFFTTILPDQCQIPEGLRVSSLSIDLVLFSWDDVFDAQSYDIRLRPVGSTDWDTNNVSLNNFAALGLLASTTYEVQVRTNCSDDSSEFSNSINFTTPDPCTEIPTGLRTTQVTSSQVGLIWNTTPSALTYTARYRVLGTSSWTSSTVSFQVKSFSGLAAGTTYEFQVRTNCAGASFDYSPSLIVTTSAANVCDVPNGLFVMGLASNQATLIWSSIESAVSYDVRYKALSASSWTTSNVAGTNLLVVTNLVSSTQYEFQVRNNCSFGSSEFSSSRNFTTLSAPATNCTATVSTFPYYESFENGTGYWQQSTSDDFDWTEGSGGTPSRRTGPSSAYDGSEYLYVESSNPNNPNKTTILNGPCYNIGSNSTNFQFNYHMYGSSRMGSLTLEISEDGGNTWTSLWTLAGPQGNQWHSASADLSSYTGNTIQLRFVGKTGNTWRGDIGIDNLVLSTGASLNVAGNNQKATLSNDKQEGFIASSKINLFPNPVRDNLTLLFESNNPGKAKIVVMNILGKKVLERTFSINEGKNDLPLSLKQGLSGHYVLQLHLNAENIITKRFILMR